MRYLISYDLHSPGQKHTELAKELKKIGASRILQSQWLLRRDNSSATEVINFVRHLFDKNDKLLVVCLDSVDWDVTQKVLRTKIQLL